MKPNEATQTDEGNSFGKINDHVEARAIKTAGGPPSRGKKSTWTTKLHSISMVMGRRVDRSQMVQRTLNPSLKLKIPKEMEIIQENENRIQPDWRI